MPITNNDPSVRLFVGGLPYKFTEGELLSLFVPFGKVISLKIMHTQWGKSRGIGYVEFDNLASAVEAKSKLHNHKVDSERTIIVDYAKPDPFDTPEGQQRHQDALKTKQVRFARFHKNLPKSVAPQTESRFQPIAKKIIKPVFGSTRQSVYDQRVHHSRIGAKFAARSKTKGKK
jgi:RNA recognition motif-containing protein